MPQLFLKTFKHLKHNGLRKTFRDTFDYISWKLCCYKARKFDKKYNIETDTAENGYLSTESLANAKYAIPYEAIQLNVLDKMLSAIDIDHRNYTFIDLGSGKARALLYATKYPFKRFVGIEFSERLDTVAQNNCKSFLEKSRSNIDIQLHCMDATDFIFPDENLVIFLYNPFNGKVMQSVVDNLSNFIESKPFNVVVLYRNPQCEEIFEANKYLNRVFRSATFNIYLRNSPSRR